CRSLQPRLAGGYDKKPSVAQVRGKLALPPGNLTPLLVELLPPVLGRGDGDALDDGLQPGAHPHLSAGIRIESSSAVWGARLTRSIWNGRRYKASSHRA